MAYNQLINGIYWGYNPLILTFDPNFLVFNFIKFQTELITHEQISFLWKVNLLQNCHLDQGLWNYILGYPFSQE